MTRLPGPVGALALAAAALVLVVVLAACGNGPSPTPKDVEVEPQGSSPPTVQPTPTEPSPPLRPEATAQPGATQPGTIGSPTPLPTPHPETSSWVEQRLDAVVALYGPTPAGEALIRSLDLRQMQGEPGFFGSFGFTSWAGVGEARPIGVMHELGHSYWGGFPVLGRPDLRLERLEEEDVSPALASYHQDILTFMAQPPDAYELLRQRLRNLPELSEENTEPVIHILEADVPYATGGSFELVPPILRKYWGSFLTPGPFGTWEEAAGWFQALSSEQRATANKFLGFEHLDLRSYPDLPPFTPGLDLIARGDIIFATEERQRLTDLAEQFDLLLGKAQTEEDFEFWRRYLLDKVTLHWAHPNHLDSLTLPRAPDLAAALKFLTDLDGDYPESQASRLAEQIPVQPFLVNFLPAVDNQALVDLFDSGADLPEGTTLQATASFVERLQRFGREVDRILLAGHENAGAGAEALEGFLLDTGFDREADLKLFFDLFRDADSGSAGRIMAAVNKKTVRALIVAVPFRLRSLLGPNDLLDKLDVTGKASEADLRRGITLLIEEPSGNFRVDEPFLKSLFGVMADRVRTAPNRTGRVIAETPFPLGGMIVNQPAAASNMLSSNLRRALSLVKNSDPVIAPPSRILYQLIRADAPLAAVLVVAFDQRGENELVVETLSYFAYDSARSDKFPELPISVSQVGTFLGSLLEQQGADWLQARLAEAVELYRGRIAREEVAPDFLDRYRDTLDAAAGTLDIQEASSLYYIIRPAFGSSGR